MNLRWATKLSLVTHWMCLPKPFWMYIYKILYFFPPLSGWWPVLCVGPCHREWPDGGDQHHIQDHWHAWLSQQWQWSKCCWNLRDQSDFSHQVSLLWCIEQRAHLYHLILCRETGSIEQHAEALVTLLESCLSHNLKPSPKDEDPPHAKISSDIISCLFLVIIDIYYTITCGKHLLVSLCFVLQNYSKKEVMKRALPVAVKFLHKGNRELSRNMSSYLSLAAIENADLLALHIQPIIDSIISGELPVCTLLTGHV